MHWLKTSEDNIKNDMFNFIIVEDNINYSLFVYKLHYYWACNFNCQQM